MKNQLLKTVLLLGTLTISACGGTSYGDQPWNDETKGLVNTLLGNENLVPYFDGYVSYTSSRKDDDISNYSIVTISGAVNNTETAVSSYRQTVLKSKLWVETTASSEDLAYFVINNTEVTLYTYLDCYMLDSDFVIEAGVKNPNPTEWTTAEKTLMDRYIGQGIYIPFYYIDNSYLEECYFEGSSTPQGVSYCSTTEASEAVTAYSNYIRTLSDFTLVSSATDDYLFSKAIDATTTFYIEVYLFNELFDVDGYIETTPAVEPTEDNITADITLLPTNFYISSGSEYGANNLVCSGGGMHYTTTLTKKGYKKEDAIQMKGASDSHFENVNQLPALTSITINQITEGLGYDGTYTVYGGTSSSTLEVITGVNGVYTMNNATYFKIANESSYACYARSITFDFASL